MTSDELVSALKRALELPTGTSIYASGARLYASIDNTLELRFASLEVSIPLAENDEASA